MRLSDLVDPRHLPRPADADRPIAGITADSRAVRPGFLFAALPGTRLDGRAFVPQAVAAGAAAILAERRPEGLPDEVAFVAAEDARAALAHTAARYYPRQPKTVVAVTGTSGKTSVAAFVRQIWSMLGHQAASLGTIGLVTPNGAVYGSLTTPDPITLHATLDRLVHENVSHMAMEASSHGLDQRRLDGVRLAAAAYTNIDRDHMDYHADFDAYLAAKLRLFDTVLPAGGGAVVNADAACADRVVACAHARRQAVVTLGEAGGTIAVRGVEPLPYGQQLHLTHAERDYTVLLPLAGRFQWSNALVAAGLAIATGSPAERVFAALESLKGVKGRLERVGESRGAGVFIDYAHKPDALANALQALRPVTPGRLIVVFGAGGDRDPGKRVLMGEAAARHADIVVVTDDNPRSEDPTAIRRAILEGAPEAREIEGRGAAIGAAIAMAGQGDTVLIAGKGHETGQIVGDTVLPFSDHEAAAEAMREAAGV